MASIFIRKGSPYFWIKKRQPDGAWKNSSTGVRWDMTGGRRLAQVRAHLASATETDLRAGRGSAALETWVPIFLRSRYAELSPKTFLRYSQVWATLACFLREKEIVTASQLTRHLVKQYPFWRVNDNGGRKRGGWNTALIDLKILSVILGDAVERGEIIGNPAFRLGFKRRRVAKKEPVTHEDEATIERRLRETKAPDWMRISWAIAMRQGCRLGETSVPLIRIKENVETPTITFLTKGDKLHLAPLHPDLVPLIRKLRRQGATHTCLLPIHAARIWRRWFHTKAGTSVKYSFHCTRVTVVTRLGAANFAQPLVKDYVGHASTTVNDVYRNLKVSQLVALSASLGDGARGTADGS
jgi:integrase